jgi:hypothetical protein
MIWSSTPKISASKRLQKPSAMPSGFSTKIECHTEKRWAHGATAP